MSSFQVLMLAGTAIIAHLALVMGSRKINPMFLIAGAFVILSLLSVAVGFSMFVAAKYARVYTTVLMVGCGATIYRIHGLDRAVKTFGVFILYDLLSPLWSLVPLTGLTYKSFFVLSFISGVFVAYSIRQWKDAVVGFRYMVVLSAAGATYAVLFHVPLNSLANDMSSSRLQFLDLNPGRIGATAATMFLLCSYVGLYDPSRFWRAVGWATCAQLAVLVVLSGNRSGALMAFVGTCITALPLLQRPRKMVPILLGAVTLVALGFLLLRDTYGGQRMFLTKNTRTTQWNTNTDIIAQAPIFGHGWIYTGSSTGYANLHSMYYQVAAEMGIVGLVMFLACSMAILLQWFQVYRGLPRVPVGSEFVILPLTFIASVLVLGLFETAGMAGTSADALFWGFGVGLIDRLPGLLQQESVSMRRRWRYTHTAVPGVG